jgi:hypothetical protein
MERNHDSLLLDVGFYAHECVLIRWGMSESSLLRKRYVLAVCLLCALSRIKKPCTTPQQTWNMPLPEYSTEPKSTPLERLIVMDMSPFVHWYFVAFLLFAPLPFLCPGRRFYLVPCGICLRDIDVTHYL